MTPSLNPDADSVDGGWTNEVGGTSLFGSVDESTTPNDFDYIQSSLSPSLDVCRLRLSDPGGTPSQPVTISTRYKKSGSDPIDLAVRLVQGASTEIAQWTYVGITTSFVTATETLTSAQFALITDFNDLFIELTASTSLFGVVDYLNGNVVSDPYDGAETGFSASWVAAVVADGGTVSAGRQTLVDTLISGLMADGIWRKLDRLWLFAAENSQSALRDIRKNMLATMVNSPTFTVDRGIAGNGTSSYVNTLYTPSMSNVWTLNYGHYGLWFEGNEDTGGTSHDMMGGVGAGADDYCHVLNNGSAGSYLGYMSASSLLNFTTNNTAPGNFVVTGNNISGGIDSYFNGTHNAGPGNFQSKLTTVPLFVGASNNNGTAANFNSTTVGGCHFGAWLSSTEVTNLYNRLRTYMTAVGAP